MSDDLTFPSLLDIWESRLDADPDADLDAFLDEHFATASSIPPDFREQAMRLAKMQRKLAALEETATGSDTSKSGESRLNLSHLAEGTEPVPGYRLVGKLGAGGFGEVWKAEGPGGFHVALKFVRLDGRAGEIELRSLEVMREVRHPNLLGIFGTWQQDEMLVIASELADRTLLDRLREVLDEGKPGIPLQELLVYMQEAAKGIDFLNRPPNPERTNIQHRDIKPQNLLLSGGSVKVGDFGLVRGLAGDATGHTGSLSLAYAAPEFLAGQTSEHSDQYSLAVTYCQLRSGQLPFQGNAMELIEGHRSGSPDLSMLPEDEREVVARSLDKNPARRWPDCASFVETLAKTVDSREPAYFETPRQRKLRPRIVAAIFGAILLCGIAWLALRTGPDSSPIDPEISGEPELAQVEGERPTASRTAISGRDQVALAQNGVERRRQVEQRLKTLFADFPLSVMEYRGDQVQIELDGTVTAVVECRVQLSKYRAFIESVREIVEPVSSLSGVGKFPLDSTGTELDYQTGVGEPHVDRFREILYGDDPPKEGIVILGYGQSGDRRNSVLTARWMIVDLVVADVLRDAYSHASLASLECELLAENGRTLATDLIRPAVYTKGFDNRFGRMPMSPVTNANGVHLLELDWHNDYYSEDHVFVFFPAMLEPVDLDESRSYLRLSDNESSLIPVSFSVDTEQLDQISELVVTPSLPKRDSP